MIKKFPNKYLKILYAKNSKQIARKFARPNYTGLQSHYNIFYSVGWEVLIVHDEWKMALVTVLVELKLRG